MQKYAFRAMGTSVVCFVEADHDAMPAFHAVEAEFERLEEIMSRFRAESELSRLNREGRIQASQDLYEVTRLSLRAREETRGRFDPTVHDAVVAAGYDRTFEEIRELPRSAPAKALAGGRVVLAEGSAAIELEPGFRLDLGGIGKGYAVDRACRLLAESGPCLVNAGGDIAVRSRPRSGRWPIGVDTPAGTFSLGLDSGALATSGRDRRRWRWRGREHHHLIDPATGAPSESDLLRVTAVGRTAVEAEIRAKALFLAGMDEALAEAADLGIAAVLVTRDGRTILVGALA
jgi:thiamine biosynthesis lipoprotein